MSNPDTMIVGRRVYEELRVQARRTHMPAREWQLREAIRQQEAGGEDTSKAREALEDYFYPLRKLREKAGMPDQAVIEED